MKGINKVILIGNLGKDPEVRYTSSGKCVCNFSLATTEKSKDNEYTEWHRVVAWDRLGEVCGEYLSKGSPVYIEGTIRTRKWQDKDGNDRYSTEIIARDVNFLPSGERKTDSPDWDSPGEPPDTFNLEPGEGDIDDSDVPF